VAETVLFKMAHFVPNHLLNDGAFRYDARLNSNRLQQWLDEGLGDGVFRAKGFLALDHPEKAYVLQFCGGRASFDLYEGPLTGTLIVFIGKNIDAATLVQQLTDCLCAPSTPT
jgi:G3E family GTPase